MRHLAFRRLWPLLIVLVILVTLGALATMRPSNQRTWVPEQAVLPLAEWEATRDTLLLWTQVVGKVRLAQSPLRNHWWNVPLYVTARGLTTSLMRRPQCTWIDQISAKPPSCGSRSSSSLMFVGSLNSRSTGSLNGRGFRCESAPPYGMLTMNWRES